MDGLLAPGGQLQHPVAAEIGDVEVAAGVDRDTGGLLKVGERQRGWILAPGASFNTRLLPESAT